MLDLPLLFSQPDARIAFDVVLASFVVLEWRVRAQPSERERVEVDHGSLLVIFAAFYVALGGAFLLAARVQGLRCRTSGGRCSSRA